jgi:large conductance mechanosensitive channel
MKIVKEFKEFVMRGNVVDLAVGVIIGAAFGKIVTSMVEDVLMPIIGIAGKADFSNLYLYIGTDAAVREQINKAAASPTPLSLVDARKLGPMLAWGDFITVAINFLIVAFCIFLMIKAINTLMRKPAPAPAVPPPPTKDQELLMQIRDLLAKR